MLDFALVLLVDALHNQLDKHRRLRSETLQVYLLSVIGTVDSFTVMEKVGHLNAQEQRFFRKFDVENIVRAIIGDNREISFRFEMLKR